MKKILLCFSLILLTIVSLNSNLIFALDPDSYLEEPVIPDYDRIYKEDGIWYGIIEIDNINIFAVDANAALNDITITDYHEYHYFLEFSFNRDTKYLNSIVLQFHYEGYCAVGFWFICSLYHDDYDSGVITYNYDPNSVALADAKTIIEAFGDGSITYSADPNYDYVIDLNIVTTKLTDVYLDVLSFVYVLEDYEVIAINEEIQQQYDNEVYDILQNGSLDLLEKQIALEQLNIEYQSYTIVFNEEIESLCTDEELCHVEFETPVNDNDSEVILPNGTDGTGIIIIIVLIVVGVVLIQVTGLFKPIMNIAELIADAIRPGLTILITSMAEGSVKILRSKYFYIIMLISWFLIFLYNLGIELPVLHIIGFYTVMIPIFKFLTLLKNLFIA